MNDADDKNSPPVSKRVKTFYTDDRNARKFREFEQKKGRKSEPTHSLIRLYLSKYLVRMALIEGDPWFEGKDVGWAFFHDASSDTLNQIVNMEDQMVIRSPPIYGYQKHILVNESGLYALCLSSKLPTAKESTDCFMREVWDLIEEIEVYTKSRIEDVGIAGLGGGEMIGRSE